MGNYSKKVKRLQQIQLVSILVLLIAFISVYMFINRPELTKYVVRDECGEIGGAVSHSIDDTDACVSACTAYCQSFQKEYHKSKFIESTLSCHTCDCTCSEII